MGKKQEEAGEEPTSVDHAVKPNGAVIYADAGVRPVNPGFGGWGFHGYVFSSEAPKKPMGPSNLTLTSTGYAPKSEKLPEVTPVKYLDAFGTIPYASNNGAEVLAAAAAMECVARWGVENVTIKTDSQYVIKGATEYLGRWKNNNWCKADGQQISNMEHWQVLDKNLIALGDQGAKVKFEWVKGHNGDQGNEMADKYATIGALTSGAGHSKQMVQLGDPIVYWKEEEESHPLIAHRSMYMVTNPEHIVKGEYYCGGHGKDDELLGKRMADGTYAYIQLEQADPYIELLVKKQLQVSQHEDHVILVRLDELLKPKTRKDLMTFGEDLFVPAGPRPRQQHDLKVVGGSDEEPISQRLNPPLLAMRAVESVNFLKGMFLAWKEGKLEGVAVTDITDCFYEDDIKKSNKKGEPPQVAGKKIRADFTSANSAIGVKGNIPIAPTSVTCPPGEVLTNKTLSANGVTLPVTGTLATLCNATEFTTKTLSPKVGDSWQDTTTGITHVWLVDKEGVGGWAELSPAAAEMLKGSRTACLTTATGGGPFIHLTSPQLVAPTIDLELIVNIDIPNRNVFKRIEKLEPKITLLVWKDSEKAYRYATIIEAKGGKAIWCGYYSNYKYVN